jgi:hypothetical protein
MAWLRIRRERRFLNLKSRGAELLMNKPRIIRQDGSGPAPAMG